MLLLSSRIIDIHKYKDQVHDEGDRAGNIPIPTISSSTLMAPLHSRLPDYKDQAQSALHVQQVRVSDVISDNTSRLPQYKDQVFDVGDSTPTTNSSGGVPVAPQHHRLPNQAQSALQVHSVRDSDTVVGNSRNQGMGKKNTTIISDTTAVSSSQSRLPEYKDQAQNV